MSAKHPVIAVTGSSGAGTTTTSLAFRKIFRAVKSACSRGGRRQFSPLHPPEMDMAIRKARDAGRHISYFGPEANDFGLLEQTFIEYGQSGKEISQISAYLRRSRTVESGTGDIHPMASLYRNPLMYCFMKVYTAASSRHSITLRSMWIYWSAWCLSLTLSGFKTDPRHQRARALTRSSDGLSSALNGRLYQLHHTAVFPHPS